MHPVLISDHERIWRDGKLIREILNGVDITTNIGKTPGELGIQLGVPSMELLRNLPANSPTTGGTRSPNAFTHGPGTELKKLIAKFGFKPKAGCKCNQRAAEMNRRGPDWCEQNINTLTGWLREEADRAGYPFTEFGAKLLIRRAIKNSRKL